VESELDEHDGGLMLLPMVLLQLWMLWMLPRLLLVIRLIPVVTAAVDSTTAFASADSSNNPPSHRTEQPGKKPTLIRI
jgi:cytochrome c-type biogenesis protein CcmH/NrfF